MVGDIGSKYGWECESEWLRRGAFPSGNHHGSSLFMDIQRQWKAISPVDLVKEFHFNSSTKYWIILNLPKNDERGHLLKNLSWDYHHGGSTGAPLWPSDHPLALNDVPDIPTESLKMIREGAVEAQQRLLCGVGKKNYNLQPFCFLLPLMRISLANNRFIFSNNSSACQRQ